MRVYNKGGGIISYHELSFVPGKYVDVPPEHEEGVKKLLPKYAATLIDGGSLDAEIIARKTRLEAAEAELVELKTKLKTVEDQNSKLRTLVENGGIPESSTSADKTSAEVAKKTVKAPKLTGM